MRQTNEEVQERRTKNLSKQHRKNDRSTGKRPSTKGKTIAKWKMWSNMVSCLRATEQHDVHIQGPQCDRCDAWPSFYLCFWENPDVEIVTLKWR